jgi:hypothetical protein
MIALPQSLRAALAANGAATRDARRAARAEPDSVPLLKLFNPLGAATWLATELGDDGDTLFGLADLGFGCPELGYFSLLEIDSVRLPFGLGIERDEDFRTPFALSVWAEQARRSGSILQAEAVLRAAARIPPGP